MRLAKKVTEIISIILHGGRIDSGAINLGLLLIVGETVLHELPSN